MELRLQTVIEAGIPRSLADSYLESVAPDSFRLHLSKYIQKLDICAKEGYGLYVCGPNGCGKTYGLSVLAKAMLVKGFSVKWISSSDLNDVAFGKDEIISKVGSQSEIVTTQFLIVDPFETLQQKALDMLIKRVSNNRPVIFSGTQSLVDLSIKPEYLAKLKQKTAVLVIQKPVIYNANVNEILF